LTAEILYQYRLQGSTTPSDKSSIVNRNRQSQSTIVNLNPQSSIEKSAVANPQSAIVRLRS
jgi:hypothetical protein